MVLPLALGAMGRAAMSSAPTIAKGPAGKAGSELADLAPDILKHKDKLLGNQGKPELVNSLKDLMGKIPKDQKDALVDMMKGAIGLDDKAFSAFSTLFKGGKFSEIPLDQLLSAGKFIYDMASKL